MAEKEDEKRRPTGARPQIGVPRPASDRDPGKGPVMRKTLPRTTRGLSAPVQRKPGAIGEVTTDSVHEAADAGTETPSGPLPHQAQLEASFGRDLSGIQAHTSPAAQESAAAMGAEAYATGDHVVAPPGAGLGLVAHEVTHVLQQQQGVQLKGGVDGGTGDPHEREADDVAAAVERGESVAHRFGAGSGSAGPGTVQRDGGPVPVPSSDPLAQVKLQKMQAGLVALTSRWKNVPGDVFTSTEKPVTAIPQWQQACYELVHADRADLAPLQDILNGPGREAYLAAFKDLFHKLDSDRPHLDLIKKDCDDICAGGQIPYLGPRLMANHALLSPFGKRAVATQGRFGVADLDTYTQSRAASDGALESAVGSGEDTKRVYDRKAACESVLRMLRTGAPYVEPGVVGPPKTTVVSPEDRKKADDLLAEIKAINTAKKPDPDAIAALIAKIKATAPEIQDLVWTDQAAVGALVRALSPDAARGLILDLDPIEGLYKKCSDLRAGDETPAANAAVRALPANIGDKIRNDVRESHKLKDKSEVGKEILGWLRLRTAEDQKPLRARLLTHTKLKDDFIDRLPADQNRLVYRLIVRGTEEPTPEDLVYQAAEEKKGDEVVRGLRLIAGGAGGPARLKALEVDLGFRSAVEAMTEVVDVDGTPTRPYHFALHLWGRKVGDSHDPSVAVLTEVNVEKEQEPLPIAQRIQLNNELFDPALAELRAEVTGEAAKDRMTESVGSTAFAVASVVAMPGSYGRMTQGDPQRIQDMLRKWDRKSSEEPYLGFLRREKLVFGPELDARYFRLHNVALRTWIYEHSGPNNRSGSNRVLGTEQGAAVGMFNGEMMLADDKRELPPGKMSLQQALREHRYKEGSDEWPLYEWASVQSRAMARQVNDSDVEGTLAEWWKFERAVVSQAHEIREKTGILIRAIDLMRNAYLEHSGHMETRIARHFKDDKLKRVREVLGLYEGVDAVAGGQPPPIAEQAVASYGEQAAALWSLIGKLNQYSAYDAYTVVKTTLDVGNQIPRIEGAEPGKPAATASVGHDVEERPPRSFAGFYRAHYGVSPQQHCAAARRAMGHPRTITDEQAAELLGIPVAMLTGPLTADARDDGTIGPHNRVLIGADFTEEIAKNNATKMWKILHGDGDGTLQTIEKELYGVYNDEEQRLIRVHFRNLSGGFDLTFYIRQAIEERARLKAEAQKSSNSPYDQMPYVIEEKSSKQAFTIGAEGTAAGDDAVGGLMGGAIRTRGSESELDRALSIGMSGIIDPKTRLRNAIARDSDDQVLQVIDELSAEERKAVLRDGALTDAIYGQLSQYNYERAFKTLTGQSDLADKMFSRSHGGSWWERKVTGGTDESGMKKDITAHIRKLNKQYDAEVRAEAAARFTPPLPGEIEKLVDREINRRVKDACIGLISEKDVHAIMSHELENDEFKEMISMLANAGEARDWAVAGGAGAAQILAEIRGLTPDERAAKRGDPNYLSMLGQRLRDEKDYRDALNALNAGSADGKTNLSTLSELDSKSRGSDQIEGSDRSGKETLRKLAELTPEEHARLLGDAAMQAQIMAALDESQRMLAREILDRPSGIAKGADGKEPTPDAVKAARTDFVVGQTVSRLRIECRAHYAWKHVIDAGVLAYTADLPKAEPKAKDRGPRGVVWDRVEADVKDFAKYHDDHAFEMTSDAISGGDMIRVLEAAVLGTSDPSDYAVRAKILTKEEQLARNPNAGYMGPTVGTIPIDHQADEDELKSVLENASDEHLIEHWTSVKHEPPGGGPTMEQKYLTYRKEYEEAVPAMKAREAAKNVPPPEPPAVDPAAPAQEPKAPAGQEWNKELHALGDADSSIAQAELARQQFLLYVISVSATFEEMLRPYMGDHRELTPPNSNDPNAAKLKTTKNKRYNNLAEVIYARIPRLDHEKLAKALKMDPADAWLLATGARSEVNTFNLRHEKNLRSRGTQTSERSVAGAEKEALDSSIVDYGRGHRVALTDAHMTGAETAQQAHLGSMNDQAREAYKTALETAAMWATLIVGTLIAVVAAILTGGLALGPLAMMAVGVATAALSATAKSMINKDILDDEWDSKNTAQLISEEMLTSLITMGATFYGAKLLSSLGGFGKAAQQANAAKAIFGGPKPALWKVFLKEAGEEMTEEAITGVVEAGLAATDPAHYVDGYREGADKAKKAGWNRLSSIPKDTLKSGVTSLLTSTVTHGAKKIRGKGGDDIDVETPGSDVGKKPRRVSVVKNIKQVFGAPEEKLSGALVEWAMSQEAPIDWSKAPQQLLKGLIEEYGDDARNIHVGTAQAGDRNSRIKKHLAIHGHDLSAKEAEAFSKMNNDPSSPFVTVSDYARLRTEVAMNSLASWEGSHVQLNDEQRAAFVKYVREATDPDEMAKRAKEDPMKVQGVIDAAAQHVGNAKQIDTKAQHGDQEIESSFRGMPREGEQRPTLHNDSIVAGVEQARTQLQHVFAAIPDAAGTTIEADDLGDGAVRLTMTLSNNRGIVTVVVRPNPHPEVENARIERQKSGNFLVWVSPQMRAQDLQRMVSHELAEILTMKLRPDGPTNQQNALDERAAGSAVPKHEQLSPHDVGRLAEMHVLLSQFDTATNESDRADHERELRVLIKHFGFQWGELDARMAELLGPVASASLGRAYARTGAPLKIGGSGQSDPAALERARADAESNAEDGRLVVGSALRDRDTDTPHQPRALIDAARGKLEAAAAQFGQILSIEKTEDKTALPGTGNRQFSMDTYAITVGPPPGERFTIRLDAGPLPGDAASRAVFNPSKKGTSVDATGRHEITGRHVIELSDKIPLHQIQRALIDEIAIILARRQLTADGMTATQSMLRAGVMPPTDHERLSPNDEGLVAQLSFLAGLAMQPHGGGKARREILALIEHMGLRVGTDGADARMRLIRLDQDKLDLINELRQPASSLAQADQDSLTEIGRQAAIDEQKLAQERNEAPLHQVPSTGRPTSQAEAKKLAEAAERRRAAVSAATMAYYRAQQQAEPAGRHPRVNGPMIGAGASLAGRTSDRLLIDARQRWQQDASKDIAQTGTQMAGLVDAGMGIPSEFAGPNQRVPMEAVTFWEDDIAAQGPVINGTARVEVAADGRVLLHITPVPDDGGGVLTLEMEGTPTIASGFPKERVPGAVYLPPALTTLRGALRKLEAAGSTVVGPALAALEAIDGMNEADAARILTALTTDVRTELLADPATRDAMQKLFDQLGVAKTWGDMRAADAADGNKNLFFADEANEKTVREILAKPENKGKTWIIGGIGGTGISAAEVILLADPTAHVHMIGPSSPAGLNENDQFRSVLERHADPDTAAMFHLGPPEDGPRTGQFKIINKMYLDAVTPGVDADGDTVYQTKRKHSETGVVTDVTAEFFVAGLGREGQIPAAMAAAIRKQWEADPNSVRLDLQFDPDGQYVGYVIEVKLPDPDRPGQTRIVPFEVTGAATRFVPMELIKDAAKRKELQKILDEQSDHDAFSESGGFDGGFKSSAAQAERNARDRERREQERKRRARRSRR